MGEKVLGPAHDMCGIVSDGMGEAHRLRGELGEATKWFQRGVAILEKAVGPDHPDLADGLLGIGRVQLAKRAAASSLAPLERALAIRTAQPGDGLRLADIRFTLAEALWQTGSRPRAVKLAQLAQGTYQGLGERGRRKLAESDAWLKGHVLK
jgi:hypothetical protein